MNDNNITKIITPPNYRALKPITVGEIPQVYLDSLTYAEQILELIKYIRDVVYPTLVNVINTTNENIELMNEALENFKTTLDSMITDIENFKATITNEWETYQTTVNNKLDEYEQLYHNFEMSITNQFTEFQNNMNTQFNEFRNDVNNTLENYQNTINGAVNDVNKMVDYLTNGATVLIPVPQSDLYPTNILNKYNELVVSSNIFNYEFKHNNTYILGGVQGTINNTTGDLISFNINNTKDSGFFYYRDFESIDKYIFFNKVNDKFIANEESNIIYFDSDNNIHINIANFEELIKPKVIEPLLVINNIFETDGNNIFEKMGNYYNTIEHGATPSEYTYFSNILSRMEEIIETGKIDVTADFDPQFNELKQDIANLENKETTDISNLQSNINNIENQLTEHIASANSIQQNNQTMLDTHTEQIASFNQTINEDLEPLIGEVASNSANITSLKNDFKIETINVTLERYTDTNEIDGHNVSIKTAASNFLQSGDYTNYTIIGTMYKNNANNQIRTGDNLTTVIYSRNTDTGLLYYLGKRKAIECQINNNNQINGTMRIQDDSQNVDLSYTVYIIMKKY